MDASRGKGKMNNYYIYMNDKHCQKTRIKRENIKDILEVFTTQFTDYQLATFEVTCWKGQLELSIFQECIDKIVNYGGEIIFQRNEDMYTQIYVNKDNYSEVLKLKQQYNLPGLIKFNINFNFKDYDYCNIPEAKNIYKKHNSILILVDSDKYAAVYFELVFPFELLNQFGKNELTKIEQILKITFLPKRFFALVYNEKANKYRSKRIHLNSSMKCSTD